MFCVYFNVVVDKGIEFIVFDDIEFILFLLLFVDDIALDFVGVFDKFYDDDIICGPINVFVVDDEYLFIWDTDDENNYDGIFNFEFGLFDNYLKVLDVDVVVFNVLELL